MDILTCKPSNCASAFRMEFSFFVKGVIWNLGLTVLSRKRHFKRNRPSKHKSFIWLVESKF